MAKKPTFDHLFNDSEDEIADVPQESQDFAELLAQSSSGTQRKLHVGDKITGQILSIGRDESFVSLGSHIDGVILNLDLLDEKKELKYAVGDSLDVVVVRISQDEVRVTRKGSRNAPVDFSNLEDAFDMELAVEGKVTEVVKGGFRVLVHGQSAFCPISQLDRNVAKDPTIYIGKKFEFIITQFDASKRNMVVSRRKLLDLQKAEFEGVWLEKNKVEDIVPGVVTRVENYGAFVDVGNGVEGLVHVSEIGFVRLKHAADGVALGENVQVKILKTDEVDGRLKISLSIKQAGGAMDPWMQVPMNFPVGAVVDGVVDKKADFGLFVVLTNGINGLLPKSKWRDADDAGVYEKKRTGDAIKVRIDEIKFEERKISLGLPTDAEDESWRSHQNTKGMGGGFASAFAVATKLKK